MRATILPYAIILTKAHRVRVLPLRCFLYLLPNYTNILVLSLYALYSDEPEVFLLIYSQTAILYAGHSGGL